MSACCGRRRLASRPIWPAPPRSPGTSPSNPSSPSVDEGEGSAQRDEDGCPACSTYLGEVAEVVDDLRSWATRVVGVYTVGAPDLKLPFPLLRDDGGVTRQRLGIGGREAAVILADRWGEVFEATTVDDDHGFPPAGQLVESAKIVDLGCGECNAPSPEWLALER